MTDKDFNIVKVNQSYCNMLDKKAENCIGQKCYNNRPGEKCHTKECPLNQIINLGKDKIECECSKTIKEILKIDQKMSRGTLKE